jgi:hypothetical protein
MVINSTNTKWTIVSRLNWTHWSCISIDRNSSVSLVLVMILRSGHWTAITRSRLPPQLHTFTKEPIWNYSFLKSLYHLITNIALMVLVATFMSFIIEYSQILETISIQKGTLIWSLTKFSFFVLIGTSKLAYTKGN